jgi:outer membrane protein OmpA-like peptidoglycan-associated protein
MVTKRSILIGLTSLLTYTFSYAQSGNDKKLFQQAKKLFDDNKFTEALPIFNTLHQNDPDNLSYFYRLGASMAMTGQDKQEALKHLHKTREVQPEFTEVHFFLMKAYLNAGDYEKVNEHYELLLQGDDEKQINKRIDMANDLLAQAQVAQDKKVEEVEAARKKAEQEELAAKEKLAKEQLALQELKVKEDQAKEAMNQPVEIKPVDDLSYKKNNLSAEVVETKLSAVKNIIIKNITYEFAKIDLQEMYNPEIAQLLQLLKENKDLKIELIGHTDNKGTDHYNIGLGERRARAVASYFRNGGIAVSRIVVKSKGESEPIAPNENNDGSDNPLGREKNRRVEIKLINPPASIAVKYEH